MESPLLDVFMSYLDDDAPHLAEETRSEIRCAFDEFIHKRMSRSDFASMLQDKARTQHPLAKVEVILDIPDKPPFLSYDDYSDVTSIRKKVRPWMQCEDNRLIAGIHKFGLDNWVKVDDFVGNGRTRSQCAQRWSRCLDPKISKNRWSPDDDQKLLSIIKNSSRSWTAVASAMGNRSDVQCRYHFMQLVKEGKADERLVDLINKGKQNPPKIQRKRSASFNTMMNGYNYYYPYQQQQNYMMQHQAIFNQQSLPRNYVSSPVVLPNFKGIQLPPVKNKVMPSEYPTPQSQNYNNEIQFSKKAMSSEQLSDTDELLFNKNGPDFFDNNFEYFF